MGCALGAQVCPTWSSSAWGIGGRVRILALDRVQYFLHDDPTVMIVGTMDRA